jgi:hypothetical protein
MSHLVTPNRLGGHEAAANDRRTDWKPVPVSPTPDIRAQADEPPRQPTQLALSVILWTFCTKELGGDVEKDRLGVREEAVKPYLPQDDDEVEVVLPWPGVKPDSTTRRPGVCSATTVRSSACPSLALEDHLLRAPDCPKHVVQHGRASTDVAVA